MNEYGRAIDSFVAHRRSVRQQQEAAEYEAMLAEQNRLLLEQQQAEQQRLLRIAQREADLKTLLTSVSDTLEHSGDSIAMLSVIDEFRHQLKINNYTSEDLQHVFDRQAFNTIVRKAHECFKQIDTKDQANFERFKTLYARYGEQFSGKSEFDRPDTDEFREKTLINAYEAPKPEMRQITPEQLINLVPPSEVLSQLRNKKRNLGWSIGLAMASNLFIPLIGAAIAVALYFFGLKPLKAQLAPCEADYEQQLEEARRLKLAEYEELHRNALACWDRERIAFEASIPSLNAEIEQHNAQVQDRCEKAQAEWERERDNFVVTINQFIDRHPLLERRFPKVGGTKEEQNRNLRAVFGIQERKD